MHYSKSSACDFGRLTRFGVINLPRVVVLAMFTLVVVGSNRAEGGIVIATPPGLHTGDTFRIAFVTDATTQATSTAISTYNAFVNTDATTEAGGGSVTYHGIPLTFSAIASTSSVDAFTNVGQSGAPIYIASGALIAQSDTSAVGGLWSGNLLLPISEDLLSANVNNEVWTGSTTSGTASPSVELGTAFAGVGRSSFANSNWVVGGIEGTFNSFPLYGLSQTLTAVPEPASIVMWLSAAGCAAVGAYVRRRRAARSWGAQNRFHFEVTLMRKSMTVLCLAAFDAFALSTMQLTAAVIPPIGLSPGSQYQLVFVTADSRDATSSSIADSWPCDQERLCFTEQQTHLEDHVR